MSLVFDSLDVSAGPTFAVDLSTPPSHDRQEEELVAAGSSFLSGLLRTNADARGKHEVRSATPSVGDLNKEEESSDSSSSIGVASDNEDDSEEEDGEVQSKSSGELCSLASLEESLPIKRGLSGFYCGKSKSFASLTDVRSVKEMEKQETPLNKRRRLMIVSKWSKKSSFYSWKNPTSMPLLTLNEEEDEETNDEQEEGEEEGDDEDENENDDSSNENEQSYRKKLHPKPFKSCFSLTDL